MTLSQFVDYVRARHNAASDDYWSDSVDIYPMITARSNEILSLLGGIEGTDTTLTTVASTQNYTIPSTVIAVKAALYNGELLQQISFREWESLKAAGTTPSGTPEKYVIWGGEIILIPIPSEAKTLTLYVEKMQSYITAPTDTIDIPAEMHFRIADGVLSDMYAKDMNVQMSRFYEDKWLNVHIPAFHRWLSRKRRRAKFQLEIDSDVAVQTEQGVV